MVFVVMAVEEQIYVPFGHLAVGLKHPQRWVNECGRIILNDDGIPVGIFAIFWTQNDFHSAKAAHVCHAASPELRCQSARLYVECPRYARVRDEPRMDRHSEIANLKLLFALYEAVETLYLTAPPTTCLVSPKGATVPCRVGILCGSFNPLTLAHTELAERALATFALDTVFFTLAKVTVDKEQVIGMSLEDRLLLLSLFAERHDKLGVALVNRGLYFEQAQAFRTLFGEETALYFLVGMDKLLQIFDP